MEYQIEVNEAALEKRFDKCAKSAAAKIIALLDGYGLIEDDLAAAMDDLPGILKSALKPAWKDLAYWPGDYMGIVPKPAEAITVVLDGLADPAKKINVIKAVREITNLGLKEAKELVEGAPKPVMENISEAEADAIVQALEQAGAKASRSYSTLASNVQS